VQGMFRSSRSEESLINRIAINISPLWGEGNRSAAFLPGNLGPRAPRGPRRGSPAGCLSRPQRARQRE
jgi:hypothetical protein